MNFWRKLLHRVNWRITRCRSDEIQALRSRVDSLDALVKTMIDIRKLPPAVGQLRLVQKADVALLTILVRVIERNGLRYWLESGSLLGAVRHNGFLPWDDDIDISMTREDYIKLLDVLKAEFGHDKRYEFYRSNCIRFQYSGTPCQIDVFPYDNFRPVDENEMSAIEREVLLLRRKLRYDWRRLKTDGKVISGMTMDEIDFGARKLAERFSRGSRDYLYSGFEAAGDTYFFTPDEDVFPLVPAMFEGVQFNLPNHGKRILTRQFGDYMAYPNAFHSHEDLMMRMSEGSIIKMRRLIEDARLQTVLQLEDW